jgi:ferredoxin-thioredoxin reductase catalytic subunit/rubredoxin
LTETEVSPKEVDAFCEKIRSIAKEAGYLLNPDDEFTMDLCRSLMINQERYGYPSCPCRLASGDRTEDLDIICPCDYRDPDLAEHGACYCALYVSRAIVSGEKKLGPVPERRPLPEQRRPGKPEIGRTEAGAALPYPVWRCKVCGYLCAREEPPDVCPICKVKKERFERFI